MEAPAGPPWCVILSDAPTGSPGLGSEVWLGPRAHQLHGRRISPTAPRLQCSDYVPMLLTIIEGYPLGMESSTASVHLCEGLFGPVMVYK